MISPGLRIGVCGTAHWAEAVHLPALKAAPGFRLAAVYGRNSARTETLAGMFETRGFQDFDAFLDAVDAVSFAVPPAVQAKLSLQALSAGKHVIFEKPVATTVKEAEALRAAVEKASVGAVCFLTRNFIPELQDFVARARAAGATAADVRFFSSALTAGSPYEHSAWRQERNASLWDVGPHLVTTLINLMGPVTTVCAQFEENGTLTGHLTHESGHASRFSAKQKMPLGPLQESVIVETPEGEQRLENFQYDRVAAFGRAASELKRTIEGDGAAKARFATAIAIVHVLAAAERSIEANGREETVGRNT